MAPVKAPTCGSGSTPGRDQPWRPRDGGNGPRASRGDGSAPGRDRAERGQLILIGGLILAVTLVSLTLILNSGIYTHNLATRSGSAADESLAVRSGVADAVGGVLADAIEEHPDDLTAQKNNVTDGVPAVREQVGRAAALDSTYANVTYVGETNGTRITQATGRNFTNANGTDDWELVGAANGIRQFHLAVNRSDLTDTTDPLAVLSDVFEVRATDTDGSEWRVVVYKNGGETKVLTHDIVNDIEYGPCSDASGSHTAINITAGTVAGDRCPALELFDRLPGDLDPASGLTVSFNSTVDTDGSPTVAGTYELTVNESESVVDDGDFQSDFSGDGPQARAAVYSVAAEFVYETSDLTFETRLTVAPGDPDD